MFEVQNSLMKSRWVFSDPDNGSVSGIVSRYCVPEVVARLLVSRGFEEDAIESFLDPTLKRDFPDPFSLAGMEEAASFLAKAIVSRSNIAVFGDFDVDGATSSALLHRFFANFGIEAPIYIPDRLTEGYGPNEDAFRKLKDGGAEIVVLCDCGSTAFEPIKAAVDMGLEVVVLDHHELGDNFPPAGHIVNPMRGDCSAGLCQLAAVGVTFLTCVAVNNILRKNGFFKNGASEFPAKEMLDIVALGTICDMVPLTGANRLFVRMGLKQMEVSSNPGIRALAQVSKIEPPYNPYHSGFMLGPRINAGSRVHRSDLGARLLSTVKDGEAIDIAWTLDDANSKRKSIQSRMIKEAVQKVEKGGYSDLSAIVVADEDWHAGIAGLVAGRLREIFGKPAAVIAFAENYDGVLEGRGSARSVPGVNVAKILMEAKDAGLLVKGGGHAMAGGFTVLPDRIEEFAGFFAQMAGEMAASNDCSVETVIDGVLSLRGLKTDFVKMLEEKIGPFGEGNPEPVFVFPQVKVISADVIGDGHLRVMMCDWEGGQRIKGMAFKAADTPMGQAFLKNPHQMFHVAGNLKINRWQGRESAEMHIVDAVCVMPDDVTVSAGNAR